MKNYKVIGDYTTVKYFDTKAEALEAASHFCLFQLFELDYLAGEYKVVRLAR